MSSLQEQVRAALSSMARFQSETLPLLHLYLKQCVEDGTYDFEAFLAILKLYQFYPELCDVDTTRTILLKALTNLPKNDFSLCLCLLTDEIQQHPQISPLLDLSGFLESCLFSQFWDILRRSPQLTSVGILIDGAPVSVLLTNFEKSIRAFIIGVIKSSYQHISRDLCSTLLGGLAGPDFDQVIASEGWAVSENGLILIASQEQLIRSKKIAEVISFESLAPLLAAQ